MEHMDALISDAFWYFIITEFKKPDERNNRFYEHLQDRLAANYVSYTLTEDPSICSKEIKEKFFKKFYNHLSQAVYQCLKTAFPKNRNTFETAAMKRKLLNTFSYMFTGVEIHGAKFRNWTNQMTSSKIEEQPTKVSLAEIGKSS